MEMKGGDIADRLLQLAASVVNIAGKLHKDTAGRHISSQIIRSGTSGGANYEEARAAESRADFIHKVGLAAKEVRETIFWLRLIKCSALINQDIDAVVREASELAAILVASVRTARTNSRA